MTDQYDYDLFVIGAGSGGFGPAALPPPTGLGSPWRRNTGLAVPA